MADASDFLFLDALSPDEQQALREQLEQHPELARDLRRWQTVRSALRGQLEQHVPDRELLVLFALDDGGSADLDAADRARLEDARSDLEAALAAHPALHDVVQRIRQERDDFAAIWDEHFEPALPRRAGDRPAATRRTDRAPARPRRWRALLGRASAAIAVLAFAAVVVLMVQRDAGMVVVEVPQDEVRVLELADGSVVRLQGGSQLTYPDADAGTLVPRRTRLTGRAFFDVAPGKGTFVVETPTAQATVLGTSFGVDAGDEATEVVLATGRLALAPLGVADRTVVLEPGQMSRVGNGALPSAPTAVELNEALAWVDLFFFDRTPVSVIAERLAEHFGVSITVAAELRDERVTGTFEKDLDVEEILRVVAATLGAEVQQVEGGGYHLRA